MSASEAEKAESRGRSSTRVLKPPGQILYMFAAGCILDVASTFFPWSRTAGSDWFLPFSVPLPLGWNVMFIPEDTAVSFICISVRLAAILGVASLLFLARFKGPAFFQIFLAISTGLSLTSFLIFSQLNWPLYIGAYIVLVGGIMKLLTIIFQNLEIHVVLEESER